MSTLRFTIQCMGAVLVAGLGLLAGCVSNDPLSPLEFARARGHWETRQPSAYRFEFSKSCECLGTESVTIEVRNGVVQSRRYTATGAAVPDGHAGLYPSIDGVFDLIAQYIRADADEIEVHYDDALGYPRAIGVDVRREAVDDEVSYSIRNFQPLDPA